jgi:hypothetical protein
MAQKKLGDWHAKTHHETYSTTTSPTTTRPTTTNPTCNNIGQKNNTHTYY